MFKLNVSFSTMNIHGRLVDLHITIQLAHAISFV